MGPFFRVRWSNVPGVDVQCRAASMQQVLGALHASIWGLVAMLRVSLQL